MRIRQVAPMWMYATFAALGVAFVTMFSWVFLKEYLAEWRTTQAVFDELQHRLKDPHALSLSPPVGEIRQIWLNDVDRVDRCTTCHLGADDSAFVGAPQPFRTHSGTWLQTHPPDRFGCSMCHGGQGEATTYRDAAHRPIPHWPEPIRPRELIEANCGVCHRERQPPQAFLLATGRDVIARTGCVACHDVPGFSLDEVRAPRLESVGYKARPDWLRRWLSNPRSYLSEARMPNFRLTPPEIEDLIAFLLSQRAVAPLDSSRVDWTKADAARGRILFGEARCVTCHMIDGRGGTLGPDLSIVGSKVRRNWVFSFINDPMRHQPQTLMLRYRLSDDENRDVVAYLMEELVDPDVSGEIPEVTYIDPKQVARGREAFARHGCYSCHRFEGMADLPKIGPSLAAIGDRAAEPAEFKGQAINPTLPNWLYVKLREPEKLAEESRMPTYNFTEQDAAAAVVALLSVRKADLPASRVTRAPTPDPYEPQGDFGVLASRYRCLSCHQLKGWGGTLSTVPLDRIGSQLQRSYLVTYLLNPGAVRVDIEERMPHFKMTLDESRALAEYLSTVFVDDALEQSTPTDTTAARRGERLFADLGCRACHIVDGRGGYVGPDLSDAGRRLKPGWVAAWLSAPEKWKPGTLQPDYGLKPEDAHALTAYLMTLSAGGSTRPQQ